MDKATDHRPTSRGDSRRRSNVIPLAARRRRRPSRGARSRKTLHRASPAARAARGRPEVGPLFLVIGITVAVVLLLHLVRP